MSRAFRNHVWIKLVLTSVNSIIDLSAFQLVDLIYPTACLGVDLQNKENTMFLPLRPVQWIIWVVRRLGYEDNMTVFPFRMFQRTQVKACKRNRGNSIWVVTEKCGPRDMLQMFVFQDTKSHYLMYWFMCSNKPWKWGQGVDGNKKAGTGSHAVRRSKRRLLIFYIINHVQLNWHMFPNWLGKQISWYTTNA